MEENRPIFVGMAHAVTKVIDKLQRGVTSMRGIGEYHESFIDFLVVLMSISTLATRWLTANLAGPTIRFLRHKRNESDIYYNIYGINNNIENRTEYILKAFDRFDYTISNHTDFYLTVNPVYHDVQKINQYLPVLIIIPPSIYDTDIQDFSIEGNAALRFDFKKLNYQLKVMYLE